MFVTMQIQLNKINCQQDWTLKHDLRECAHTYVEEQITPVILKALSAGTEMGRHAN